MTIRSPHRLTSAIAALSLAAPLTHAQTAPAAAPSPALSAPARAPQPPAPAASAPSQRIEITGGRASDTEQRRQSTAAKIVIGREEIERFGDSNTLEVLKRLPGVTVPGAPGRGGPPRMRGMGGGFTQLLIDGERIPPGFSLESIPPEQIERIEILRAPTAETGARAIAGTINIVLREGFRKKLNDVNLGAQFEHGTVSPGGSWTRNDTLGDWIVNTSLFAFRRRVANESEGQRVDTDAATGATLLERSSRSESLDQRRGANLTGRLQWRDASGSSLMVQPVFVLSEGLNRASGTVVQQSGAEPLLYDRSETMTDGRFTLARINLNFNHRLGASGPRLEWRAGHGDGHWRSDQRRLESGGATGPVARVIDEDTDNRDRNSTLSLKASALVGTGHNAVAGVELERNRRTEGKTTAIDGVPQLAEFGDALSASARRVALYAQDEWSISPRWAVHLGVRTESIVTEGEGAGGLTETNRSRVTTPLAHTVWKFDEKANDQVRLSLTRSYRSPNLNQLIGRPGINRVNPAPGANTEVTADSAGNPALRPEVALGLDLAAERYLADGGVLSANLFHRRIRDLIRNVVALEDVSWSPGAPRFVSRPRNIGQAASSGLELEAKFRIDQLVADGPRTDIRANASLFRSRVDAVPGPDNRISEQPGGTLNLGADHRFRGTPLAVGGSFNHTPGYRTRLDVDRWVVQNERNALDAYAVWTFAPETKLRVSLGNLLARDAASATQVSGGAVDQLTRGISRSYLSTQVRLELKL
jgi:outer membrane receptor for ferrienterochelin and colicins